MGVLSDAEGAGVVCSAVVIMSPRNGWARFSHSQWRARNDEHLGERAQSFSPVVTLAAWRLLSRGSSSFLHHTLFTHCATPICLKLSIYLKVVSRFLSVA